MQTRALQIGLSASTIASSFGKVVGEAKELADYRPEDMALSLLRMFSYNIGQVGARLLCGCCVSSPDWQCLGGCVQHRPGGCPPALRL